MIRDWLQKKKKNPPGDGKDSSLELEDISTKIPQVDDLLAAIDKSIKIAKEIEEQTKIRDRCGC